MKLLEGKQAVISGGSEGIGFAIAEAFVKNGADVIIISRNRDKLNSAKKQLSIYNQKVNAISFDLSDISKISALSEEINSNYGKVDILVNNAAMALFEKIENINPIELEQIIRMNVQSPFILTQQLLPSLEKTEGNIINITSYFSHKMIPERYSTAYSLTKGAMDSFTKSLACELGPRGIRVNAIAPGSIKTPLFNTAMKKMTDEQRTKFTDKVKTNYPLGRIGEPNDLGGIAVFLASEQSKWVTGSIVSVDGGLTTT